ncbi:MAG: two-component regulator propeller domain-containing protein, partial [Sediminibacterium sp.]
MKTLALTIYLLMGLVSYAQLDSIAVVGSPTLGGLNNIEETFIDYESNIWLLYANSLSINNNGVKKYDGSSWTTYQTSNSGLPNNKAFAITQDADSNIWIGTNGGLAKYKNSTWTVYNTLNSGLSSDAIYSLLIDDTILWIGTNLGITKYDGQNWTNYLIQSPFSNTVTSIEKHMDTIYGGTEFGIVKLETSGLTNYLGFAVGVGNKAHRILSTTDFGIVYQNTEGVYQFTNGKFKEISSVLGVCKLSNYTITGTSKKKYIAKNQWGGISVNYGNKITEFDTNGYREFLLQSNSGILCNTSGKYYILKGASLSYKVISFAYDSLITSMQSYQYYNVPCTSQTLDVNLVNASILDRGDMFFDVATSKSKYEVPKGSGSYAAFANSLWIGGKVNNQLRTACQTYRQSGVDFWPGLLDTVTALNPSVGIGEGNVVSVTAVEIQDFIFNYNNGNVQNSTYIPARGILDWPTSGSGNFSRNVAPYVDVNLNGIYDPLAGGDYPIIKGDQMLYQVYNDASGIHNGSGSPAAMGLEIRKKSYAFNCSNLA